MLNLIKFVFGIKKRQSGTTTTTSTENLTWAKRIKKIFSRRTTHHRLEETTNPQTNLYQPSNQPRNLPLTRENLDKFNRKFNFPQRRAIGRWKLDIPDPPPIYENLAPVYENVRRTQREDYYHLLRNLPKETQDEVYEVLHPYQGTMAKKNEKLPVTSLQERELEAMLDSLNPWVPDPSNPDTLMREMSCGWLRSQTENRGPKPVNALVDTNLLVPPNTPQSSEGKPALAPKPRLGAIPKPPRVYRRLPAPPPPEALPKPNFPDSKPPEDHYQVPRKLVIPVQPKPKPPKPPRRNQESEKP